MEMTEREKELALQLAEAEQAKANMTSELVEIRKQKQEEAAEKLRLKEELEKRSTVPDAGKATEDVVHTVLAKEREKAAQRNLELAKEEFRRMNKEFSSDTDAGNLLFQKFEREFNKFNIQGLETKEEFAARMKDAYRLISNTTPDNKVNFYTGTSNESATDPKVVDTDNLSAAEVKLFTEMGWTKEKYLSHKAKKPAFVASLLRNR